LGATHLMRLTHAELEAFCGAILELHRYRDLEEFLAEAPEILSRVTPRARLSLLPAHSAGAPGHSESARDDSPSLVAPGGAFHVEIDDSPRSASTMHSLDGDGQETERQRILLDLLRPHLELACCNARLVSAQRTAVKAAELGEYALTPREADVAHWLSAGKTNAEIARILGSSARTIEKHVERVLVKLGVENRTSAALLISNGRRP
jgi:DNA-binding CsgD family transcriptional regulator